MAQDFELGGGRRRIGEYYKKNGQSKSGHSLYPKDMRILLRQLENHYFLILIRVCLRCLDTELAAILKEAE